MQNGQPIDIPLTVDLHIEKFASGAITRVDSSAKNVIYAQYPDQRWYATQRPGVNMFENASQTVVDARGRGIYYLDAVTDRYIVNNDTVYKSSYSGSTMTISAGTQRVFMAEVGDYLVIVDQENGEAWTISTATPATITQITDTDFPTEQTPALTLARGGAELNGKLYVMTTTGDIYESDVEDPTSYGALNFRNAERSSDNGVYLTKHLDHIAAFGTRSLEFFYDNANPTGSTLEPRLDINYDVGMIDADACYHVGEETYFVGQDRSGSVGVYKLSGFQLIKVSKEDLDTFLTTSVITDGYDVVLSGFMSGGRIFVTLTTYSTPSDINPLQTLVYSSLRSWWGLWDVQLTGVDYFPLVDWQPSTTTRAGEGILTNGDLITVLDDFNPQDTEDASSVFESGVFEAGAFVATGGTNTQTPIEIITGSMDQGTSKRKRQGDMYLIHTPTVTSEDMTLAFADEQNTTFDVFDTIDVSDVQARVNRCGSYFRRNIKLTGSFTDQIRAEKLQTTVRMG